MTITDAGKQIFLEAMQRTGKPVCHIFLVDSDDGRTGMNISLIPEAEAKRIIEVNGLKIAITPEDEATLEEAVFDGEGQNLKVTMPTYGCGCGCHGHHHHEGECCRGEKDGECCCEGDCDCEDKDDCCCGGEGHCHHGA